MGAWAWAWVRGAVGPFRLDRSIHAGTAGPRLLLLLLLLVRHVVEFQGPFGQAPG